MKKITFTLFILFGLLLNMFAADTLSVTRETFGTIPYGTDGAPSTVGYAGHWNWDKCTGLTSANGHFEAGSDSSLRSTNYDMNVTGLPSDYTNPSGPAWLFLSRNNGEYAGSWDTMYYKNINIDGFRLTDMTFAWGKRNNGGAKPNARGLMISYSIDGGAYTLLDTALLLNPLAGNTWDFDTLPFPDTTGNLLTLRFCTKPGMHHIYLDDITIQGTARPVTSIEISAAGSATTITEKGGTLQLTATVTPDTASDVVTWSVDNALATIDQAGLLTAVGNGTVVVTATALDGKTDTYTVTISGQAPPVFEIAKIVHGTVTDAVDYKGGVSLKWDADSVYLQFDVDDDSIVNAGVGGGASYQVDNIEVYIDINNSKLIQWPRNDGWAGAVDPVFDANDYQIRLVPAVAYATNNSVRPAGISVGAGGVKQVYSVTATGYQFLLNIDWDTLMLGYVPALGDTIGFDVLLSDNDDAAAVNDANRNQITFNSINGNAYNDPSLWGAVKMSDGGYFSIVPDAELPTKVTGAAATVDTSAVTLTWDPSSDNIGILSYKVNLSGQAVDSKTVVAKQTGNSTTFTGLANGTYYLLVYALDNNGNQSVASELVEVEVDVPVVPGTRNNIAEFGAYPNPVSGTLSINNASTISSVEIIGINGSVVASQKNEGQDIMVIDASDLSQGLYIYKVYTLDGNVVAGKFIKE